MPPFISKISLIIPVETGSFPGNLIIFNSTSWPKAAKEPKTAENRQPGKGFFTQSPGYPQFPQVTLETTDFSAKAAENNTEFLLLILCFFSFFFRFYTVFSTISQISIF